MAVIIVIRREVDPDNQDEVFDLLKQLRARAVLQPGYLSGETLFSASQGGAHLVISRWRSLKEWRAWEKSPERRKISSKIDSLLRVPADTNVYLVSATVLPEGV